MSFQSLVSFKALAFWHAPWFKLSLDLAQIIFGVVLAAFGIKALLMPSQFIDGGAMGISMLLSDITQVSLPFWIPLVNLPFLLLAYRQFGLKFTLKSCLAILTLSLSLAWLPFPIITQDKLLSAVFGGFLIGTGIGLTIRGGGVLGGIEVAAIVISRMSHWLTVGDVILGINTLIFSAAAFFLGIEPALYSVLTYIAASRAVNFLVYGMEEYMAVTIISERQAAVQQALLRGLQLSITRYKGLLGAQAKECDILYCVLTKMNVGEVKSVTRAIDPDAFIVVHPLTDVEGGLVKRARFKETLKSQPAG
ncbi:MAG: YitT family protein [Vampirovibrionales bacterium]|nr:YitT family protein [Vampirovibrionales bacterium]